MRRSLIAAALVLATASALPTLAANYPTTNSPAATPSTAANSVLVIPFVTLNVSPDKQWIGKAVQETLIADLGQPGAGANGGGYSPIAFGGQVVVEDNATAARLAREASAPFAVRGAAQSVNGDIRLTAQLIDAKSGDTLATGIVTGKAEDLLKLEDELANQLRVGPATAPIGYRSAGTGYIPRSNSVPAPVNMNQPLNTYSYSNYPTTTDYQDYGTPAYYYSPVYSPSYLDYTSYPYYYPDYGIYYPVYPVTLFGGFGGFHHHFDGFHGGFHSGFNSGFHSGFGSGFAFHSGSFGSHASFGHGHH